MHDVMLYTYFNRKTIHLPLMCVHTCMRLVHANNYDTNKLVLLINLPIIRAKTIKESPVWSCSLWLAYKLQLKQLFFKQVNQKTTHLALESQLKKCYSAELWMLKHKRPFKNNDESQPKKVATSFPRLNVWFTESEYLN